MIPTSNIDSSGKTIANSNGILPSSLHARTARRARTHNLGKIAGLSDIFIGL
jgi:hypothetical protein